MSWYAYRKTKRLQGFSLVEMMTAIFIMGVGMIGFSLLLLRSWNSNKFILETGVSAVQVNRASAEIISTLRKIRQADNGDYPLESGGNFDIKFYVDVDGDGVTERVHYWLDTATQQLMRGVREPSNNNPPIYANGDGTTSVMADYIVNTDAQPIFYYYNNNYPGDTTNNPISTPVNVGDVRLVRVLLRINIDPVRAPNNINVESFADLRNIETYDN